MTLLSPLGWKFGSQAPGTRGCHFEEGQPQAYNTSRRSLWNSKGKDACMSCKVEGGGGGGDPGTFGLGSK